MVFKPEWNKVTGSSIWGSIISGLLCSIGTNIVVPVISRSNLGNITMSFPLVYESVVINNFIFWIILIFEFLVLANISVGNFIAWKISGSQSHLIKSNSLSLGDITSMFPYICESNIISNIIFSIINILKLFIVRFVSISEFIAVWLSWSVSHLSHLVSLPFGAVLDSG